MLYNFYSSYGNECTTHEIRQKELVFEQISQWTGCGTPFIIDYGDCTLHILFLLRRFLGQIFCTVICFSVFHNTIVICQRIKFELIFCEKSVIIPISMREAVSNE